MRPAKSPRKKTVSNPRLNEIKIQIDKLNSNLYRVRGEDDGGVHISQSVKQAFLAILPPTDVPDLNEALNALDNLLPLELMRISEIAVTAEKHAKSVLRNKESGGASPAAEEKGEVAPALEKFITDKKNQYFNNVAANWSIEFGEVEHDGQKAIHKLKLGKSKTPEETISFTGWRDLYEQIGQRDTLDSYGALKLFMKSSQYKNVIDARQNLEKDWSEKEAIRAIQNYANLIAITGNGTYAESCNMMALTNNLYAFFKEVLGDGMQYTHKRIVALETAFTVYVKHMSAALRGLSKQNKALLQAESEKIRGLREELDTAVKQKDAAVKQKKQAAKELRQVGANFEKYKQDTQPELEKLRKQKGKLNSDFRALKKRLADLLKQQEKHVGASTKDLSEKEREELNGLVKGLEEELRALREASGKDQSALQDKIAELEKQVSQLEEALAEAHNKIRELRDANGALSKENKELKDFVNEQYGQIEQLQSEGERKDQKIGEQAEEIERLKAELAERDKILKQWDEREEEWQQSYKGWEEDRTSLESENSNLAAEIERLKAEIERLKAELAAARQGADQSGEMAAKIEELEKENASLAALNEQWQESYGGLEAENSNLAAEIEQLKAEIERLKAELAAARQGADQSGEMAAKIEELEKENKKLSDWNSQWQKRGEELEVENGDLAAEIERLKTEIERLKAKLASARQGAGRTGELESKIAELEQQSAQLQQGNEQLTQENGSLREQIAQLQTQIAELKERIAQLTAKIKQLQGELANRPDDSETQRLIAELTSDRASLEAKVRQLEQDNRYWTSAQQQISILSSEGKWSGVDRAGKSVEHDVRESLKETNKLLSKIAKSKGGKVDEQTMPLLLSLQEHLTRIESKSDALLHYAVKAAVNILETASQGGDAKFDDARLKKVHADFKKYLAQNEKVTNPRSGGGGGSPARGGLFAGPSTQRRSIPSTASTSSASREEEVAEQKTVAGSRR